MRFRKLRIAFTAVCGIACVLLIALWVRSYRWQDRLEAPWPNSELINVWSTPGQLTYLKGAKPGHWRITTLPVAEWQKPIHGKWGWDSNARSTIVYAPHWGPILLLTTLGATPWVIWRFSLRTLLIATTLVAVVVGIVIAAA